MRFDDTTLNGLERLYPRGIGSAKLLAPGEDAGGTSSAHARGAAPALGPVQSIVDGEEHEQVVSTNRTEEAWQL